MTKPHFLLINDDGISSKGLYHLWKGVKDLGDVTIVAPDSQKSGTSQAFTLGSLLKVTEVKWEDQSTKAYKVAGTPVDCVKLALRALNCNPTMILSGVNCGHNLGRTILFSGTVGGIIEGIYNGIPGAAFSYFREDQPEYAHVEQYITPIVEYLLALKFPEDTFYNINFPEHIEQEIKGFKLTPHGRSNWEANYEQIPHEKDLLFCHGGSWLRHEEDIDTDCYYNKQGYITASPINITELTHKQFLENQRAQFESFVSERCKFNS